MHEYPGTVRVAENRTIGALSHKVVVDEKLHVVSWPSRRCVLSTIHRLLQQALLTKGSSAAGPEGDFSNALSWPICTRRAFSVFRTAFHQSRRADECGSAPVLFVHSP